MTPRSGDVPTIDGCESVRGSSPGSFRSGIHSGTGSPHSPRNLLHPGAVRPDSPPTRSYVSAGSRSSGTQHVSRSARRESLALTAGIGVRLPEGVSCNSAVFALESARRPLRKGSVLFSARANSPHSSPRHDGMMMMDNGGSAFGPPSPMASGAGFGSPIDYDPPHRRAASARGAPGGIHGRDSKRGDLAPRDDRDDEFEHGTRLLYGPPRASTTLPGVRRGLSFDPMPPVVLESMLPPAPPPATAGLGGGGDGGMLQGSEPAYAINGGSTSSPRALHTSAASSAIPSSALLSPRRHPLDTADTTVSRRLRGEGPPLPGLWQGTGGYSYRRFNQRPADGAQACKLVESQAWGGAARFAKGDQRLRQLRWLASASVDLSRDVEPGAHEVNILASDRRGAVLSHSVFTPTMRAEALRIARHALEDETCIEAEIGARLSSHFDAAHGPGWRCFVGRVCDYARTRVRDRYISFSIGQLHFLLLHEPPKK